LSADLPNGPGGNWNRISPKKKMSLPEGTQPEAFASETDEDLLAYMAMQGDDRPGAEQAFAEFYRRHERYLSSRCRVHRGILGEDGVSTLVQDTFLRVYQKAHTYRPKQPACDYAPRRVKAWMGKIAANIFLSQLRRNSSPEELPDDLDTKEYKSVFQRSPAEENVPPSARMKLFLEALDTLSEKERHVLIVSAEWCRLGQEFQRLPDDISQDLAAKYQSTPEAIRQTRKRAKDKVKAFVESRENEK